MYLPMCRSTKPDPRIAFRLNGPRCKGSIKGVGRIAPLVLRMSCKSSFGDIRSEIIHNSARLGANVDSGRIDEFK